MIKKFSYFKKIFILIFLFNIAFLYTAYSQQPRSEQVIFCNFKTYSFYNSNGKFKQTPDRPTKIKILLETVEMIRMSDKLTVKIPIISRDDNAIVAFRNRMSPKKNDTNPWVQMLIINKKDFKTEFLSTNSIGETIYKAKCTS